VPFIFSLADLQKQLFKYGIVKIGIGVELECYIVNAHSSSDQELALYAPTPFLCPSLDDLHFFGVAEIVKEKGLNQWETIFDWCYELDDLCQQVKRYISWIEAIAIQQGYKILWDAIPFADQPTSGLHIHLHGEDAKGNNLFQCWHDDRGKMHISYYLRTALDGMLRTMPDYLPIFAPTPDCYQRYTGQGKESPTRLCWGPNNRSSALRIPVLGHSRPVRIEHRVPSSMSALQIDQVIAAMFMGWLKGLELDKDEHAFFCDYPPIYGDAFHPQYELSRIYPLN
jgi:glutamine synthetase